jgi:hypothetical protein
MRKEGEQMITNRYVEKLLKPDLRMENRREGDGRGGMVGGGGGEKVIWNS